MADRYRIIRRKPLYDWETYNGRKDGEPPDERTEQSAISLLWWKKGDRIVGFQIYGHMGAAEAGENILCSALSAMAQSTAMGILDVLEIVPKNIVMDDGEMTLCLPDEMTAEQQMGASVLLDTMKISMDSLALDHGSMIKVRIQAIT